MRWQQQFLSVFTGGIAGDAGERYDLVLDSPDWKSAARRGTPRARHEGASHTEVHHEAEAEGPADSFRPSLPDKSERCRGCLTRSFESQSEKTLYYFWGSFV